MLPSSHEHLISICDDIDNDLGDIPCYSVGDMGNNLGDIIRLYQLK